LEFEKQRMLKEIVGNTAMIGHKSNNSDDEEMTEEYCVENNKSTTSS
jgi:hypothetical protein